MDGNISKLGVGGLHEVKCLRFMWNSEMDK